MPVIYLVSPVIFNRYPISENTFKKFRSQSVHVKMINDKSLQKKMTKYFKNSEIYGTTSKHPLNYQREHWWKAGGIIYYTLSFKNRRDLPPKNSVHYFPQIRDLQYGRTNPWVVYYNRPTVSNTRKLFKNKIESKVT